MFKKSEMETECFATTFSDCRERDEAREWTNLEEALQNRSYVLNLNLSQKGLSTIPVEIGQLNKIEFCNLSQNDLTSSKCFPEEFFGLWRLQRLDLSQNQLTELPPCLCSFLDLRYLNIQGNRFADPRRQAAQISALFPECEVVW